jgi:hypothetical protein
MFYGVSPLLVKFDSHPLQKIPEFRLALGPPPESPHAEPLRQFRYQSHKPPSVLISPEHCSDAGRPAHDRIPTVRDLDAERSRPASRVCHHVHLSLVKD